MCYYNISIVEIQKWWLQSILTNSNNYSRVQVTIKILRKTYPDIFTASDFVNFQVLLYEQSPKMSVHWYILKNSNNVRGNLKS